MSKSDEAGIAITHDDGCGGVAFYFAPAPGMRWGDEIRVSMIRWPDGTPASFGQPLRCGTCNADLDWLAVMPQLSKAAGIEAGGR